MTAGEWYSYYDGLTPTAPGGLGIDHLVPLAEAWNSGASQWTPARGEAYANGLDADRSLVAVTAKTNRNKADQDLPPGSRPCPTPAALRGSHQAALGLDR